MTNNPLRKIENLVFHQQLLLRIMSIYLQKSFGYLLLVILLQISGCTTDRPLYPLQNSHDSPPAFAINVNKIPNAVPKIEPLSKYGNPTSYKVYGTRYYVMKSAVGYRARGIASWYGMKFHNRKTASGEPYNLAVMSAAHRTLPLPTYAQVTNLKNGKQVIVKVNDRGPFVANRLIDLSYAAAKKIGVTATGTAVVEVRALLPNKPTTIPRPSRHLIKHPPASQRIFLQLGVFQQYKNAQRVRNQVKKWSHIPISIKRIYGNTHLSYRVEMGPFLDLTAAQSHYHRIAMAGLSKPILKKIP